MIRLTFKSDLLLVPVHLCSIRCCRLEPVDLNEDISCSPEYFSLFSPFLEYFALGGVTKTLSRVLLCSVTAKGLSREEDLATEAARSAYLELSMLLRLQLLAFPLNLDLEKLLLRALNIAGKLIIDYYMFVRFLLCPTVLALAVLLLLFAEV